MRAWGFVSVLAIVGLTGGCFSASGGRSDEVAAKTINPSPCLSLEDSEILAADAIELINVERAEFDLPPVSENPVLKRVADEFACRMIEEQFFGHRDPENGHGPGERAVAGRYRFRAVGENLASGPETPAEAVELWMQSRAHREVILDPRWSDLGMAVRMNDDGTYYWVQEFGDPIE